MFQRYIHFLHRSNAYNFFILGTILLIILYSFMTKLIEFQIQKRKKNSQNSKYVRILS